MERLLSGHYFSHLPFQEEKGDGFAPDTCWLYGLRIFQREWISQQCAACTQGDVCQ